MRFMSKLTKDNTGAALALVLVVMSVTFLLVAGLILVGQSENYQTIYQVDQEKAYYIARAGAESMAMELDRLFNEDSSKLSLFSTTAQTAEADDVFGISGSSITVDVTYDSSSGEFTILSKGNFGSHTEEAIIVMGYEAGDLDSAIVAEVLTGSLKEIEGGAYVEDVSELKKISKYYVDEDGNYVAINSATDAAVIPSADFSELEQIYSFDDTSMSFVTDNKVQAYPGDANVSDTSVFIDESCWLYDFSEHEYQSGNKVEEWTATSIIFDTSQADLYKISDDTTEEIKISNTPGTETDKWQVVYIETPMSITDKITVSGSNNLMLIIGDELDLSSGSFYIDDTVNSVLIILLEHDDHDSTDMTRSFEEYNGVIYDIIMNSPQSSVGAIGEIVSDIQDPGRFLMYLYGADAGLSLTTNTDVYAKIFAPDGLIYLKGGQSAIYGSVMASNVEGSASASVFYKATHLNNVDIKGMIDIDHWED